MLGTQVDDIDFITADQPSASGCSTLSPCSDESAVIGLSTRIDVPIEETTEEFNQSEFPTAVELERVAELMAARVKSVGGGNLEIGTNAAITTALRYFSEYTPNFGDNDKAMAVYGIGIHKFLQENDVMRSYVKFV